MKKILLMAALVAIVALTACENGKKETSTSGETSGEKPGIVYTSKTDTELLEELQGTSEGELEESGETIVEVIESGENIVIENAKVDYNDTNRYASVKQNPVVTMEMENGGKVMIELYPQIAPTTVENFISLVKSGFYDGLTFHRVMPTFMAQGGDPLGTGTGGPGYSIKGEFSENGFKQNNLKHDIGVISMARATPPDSAGSQFFIVTNDQSYLSLDGKYAGFGKVLDGMDVVYDIVNVEVNFASTDLNPIYEKLMAGEELDNNEIALVQAYQAGVAFDKPINPPKIKKMTVETFGVEYAEPQKINN